MAALRPGRSGSTRRSPSHAWAVLPRIRGAFRYFRDPSASLVGKLFVLATVAYIVFPLDLIPDVAPVVGWLDDLGVATLAMIFLSRVGDRYRDAPALARY